MKRITVILQTVLILVVWYVAYGTAICNRANTGEWGVTGKLLICFLPMMIVGFILGADGLIDGIREKARIYKLNVAIWFLFAVLLVFVFFIMTGRLAWMNDLQDSIVYYQLNFRDVFGMGAYSAVGLCAGHMLGSFAGKDKQNIIVNYAVVIALWFVSYDILYPMTEPAAKAGENYSISLLVLVLPMFLTGIILRVRHFGRRKEKQPFDKVNLIIFAVLVIAALAAFLSFLLLDFGINISNGSFVSKVFSFLNRSYLHMMLWLCVGNLLMQCRR